ncbi:18304_t:CDS:2, partial [Gigaspora rosea]
DPCKAYFRSSLLAFMENEVTKNKKSRKEINSGYRQRQKQKVDDLQKELKSRQEEVASQRDRINRLLGRLERMEEEKLQLQEENRRLQTAYHDILQYKLIYRNETLNNIADRNIDLPLPITSQQDITPHYENVIVPLTLNDNNEQASVILEDHSRGSSMQSSYRSVNQSTGDNGFLTCMPSFLLPNNNINQLDNQVQ